MIVKMGVDHGLISGFHAQEVVEINDRPSQRCCGSAMTASRVACNCPSMATMLDARGEDPLGWLGAKVGVEHDSV